MNDSIRFCSTARLKTFTRVRELYFSHQAVTAYILSPLFLPSEWPSYLIKGPSEFRVRKFRKNSGGRSCKYCSFLHFYTYDKSHPRRLRKSITDSHLQRRSISAKHNLAPTKYTLSFAPRRNENPQENRYM